MAVESAEDRAAFFDAGEFGCWARWQPKVGAARMVEGIFDAEFVEIEGLSDQGVPIESVNPVFWTDADKVPDIQEGDALRIDGQDYRVRSPQPDGTGTTMVRLEKVVA